MKKILIDGRFVGVGESVSRYTLEILKGILKEDSINDYTLLIRPEGEKTARQFFQDSSFQNLKIQVLDIPHYSIGEQTKLLKYLNKEKFDLVHFTQFNHPIYYKGKFVVTVHDLTMLGHLHRQNPIKRIAFNQVMKAAAKNSVKILTVSKTSKQDIIDYYGTEKDKIVVAYLGVDDKYNLLVRSHHEALGVFRDKYKISGEYILYTGMWKRHKNLLRMLQAFEKASKTGKIADRKVQLVMAGKIDKNEREVINLINQINSRQGTYGLRPEAQDLNPVVTTGFVDEEELPIAYAGASVYIIPSLSEGFGLPPLEAMASGTPVISSRESCMPEILGDAPLYFDPYNVDDMAKAMERIITDEELRKKMISKGLEQVRKYDWADTAKKTLEVYKEVLVQ